MGESRERVHHIPSREEAWSNAGSGLGERIWALGPAVLVCLTATRTVERTCDLSGKRRRPMGGELLEDSDSASPHWPWHQSHPSNNLAHKHSSWEKIWGLKSKQTTTIKYPQVTGQTLSSKWAAGPLIFHEVQLGNHGVHNDPLRAFTGCVQLVHGC